MHVVRGKLKEYYSNNVPNSPLAAANEDRMYVIIIMMMQTHHMRRRRFGFILAFPRGENVSVLMYYGCYII